MLTCRLKDVFPALLAPDNKAPVIRLNEHIFRPSRLNIVDYLAGRPTLLGSLAGMLAAWNA
jgi:hypothetical protein